TTALAPDEVLTEIRIPRPGRAAAYEKARNQASGFALVGVAVAVDRSNGAIASAGIGITGAAAKPSRAVAAEAALAGKAAPPDAVWAVLQDPDALAACIPGCRKLEPTGEHEYAATLSIGVGSFKGIYAGKVRLSDLEPTRSYALHVEGSGRPGFVKGTGRI